MTFTFSNVNVKKRLIDLLKEELPKKGFADVRVLGSDPANPAEVPCIGINRASDDEDSQTIADAQGTAYNEQTKEYRLFQGTFFRESLEIRIWHKNADERDKLYPLVKAALFAGRSDLVKEGLLNITLRSGRDEQDTTMTDAPFALYWSSITMDCLNPLDVEIIEIVEPISGFTDNGTLSRP